MATKSGLGMGLSSLIPVKNNIKIKTEKGSAKEAARDGGSGILEIDIDNISANPYQPRTSFEEGALKDLADSIKEQGVLQPLLVTEKESGEYQLVAGERRLRASKMAGLKKVPAILKEFSEQEKMEVALVENIQRENLNPIEEARVYRQLKDDYDLTLDEVAETVGKSSQTISSSIKLLSLPVEAQRYLASGQLSKLQANTILKLNNIEEQILLADKIVKDGLSQKDAETIVEKKTGSIVGSKKAGSKKIDNRLAKIEEELSGALETKVKVSGNIGRGKVVVEFFSEEELDRIMKHVTRNT